MTEQQSPTQKSYGITANNPWDGSIYVPDLDLRVEVPSIGDAANAARRAVAGELGVHDEDVMIHIIQSPEDEPAADPEQEPEVGPETTPVEETPVDPTE